MGLCKKSNEKNNNAESEIIEEKKSTTQKKSKIEKVETAVIETPDFDEILKQESKIIEAENNTVESVFADEKKDFETQKVDFENMSYVSSQLLKNFVDKHPLFFQSVLQKLFSKDGANFLFLDFENRNIYIEKNYFAKTVKSFFNYDGN